MKTINAGGKQYELQWTTGIVEETGKNMETKVSGGGGGGFMHRGTGGTAPVTIRSTTVVHDQIFITDASGREHSYQLQGFDIACRTGNKLTILWTIQKGSRSGPYVAVYNHTTSKAFYNDKAINNMHRRPVLYLAIAIILCVMLGSLASIFYAGIIIALIFWFVEGSNGASRFKNEINFNEFG